MENVYAGGAELDLTHFISREERKKEESRYENCHIFSNGDVKSFKENAKVPGHLFCSAKSITCV